ncbi:phospholipid scramblase 1-like isoform X5, partial [Dinothrombium tinctorium]
MDCGENDFDPKNPLTQHEIPPPTSDFPTTSFQPAVVVQPMPVVGPGFGVHLQNFADSNVVIQIQNNRFPPLEVLRNLPMVYMRQPVSMMKVLFGFQPNNEYAILDDRLQQVMYGIEESNCCKRNCLGPGRSFHMRIVDNENIEVIRIKRGKDCCEDCCGCDECCNCCNGVKLMEVRIGGQLIAFIKIPCDCCKPCWPFQLTIENPVGQELFRLGRACCDCSCGCMPCCFLCNCRCSPCCQDIILPILDSVGTTELGSIRKKWSNLFQECCTDADHFQVIFPYGISPELKAVFIAAAILWDFMYFEYKTKLSSVIGRIIIVYL